MSAGNVLLPREKHYSTTNCSNFHEWEAASTQILLAGFIRVHSGYSWFKDIWAGWAHGRVWQNHGQQNHFLWLGRVAGGEVRAALKT